MAAVGVLLAWSAFCADPGRGRPTFHATISAASEAASAGQSLVLVVFGADWCVPCRVMKKNVFASEQFLAAAGTLHVVEVDIDANQKLAGDYNVSVVPTLVMVTADGKIIQRHEGALTADEMLKWIGTARERASRGQWEGTAPSPRIAEFVTRAAGDNLTEADLARLVEMLGDPNPAERSAAARIIAAQRERAVAPLVNALTNSYLGVRIGASELLARLAPEAPSLDPWLAPAEIGAGADAFRAWWAGKGTLPAVVEAKSRDTSAESSVKSALEAVRSEDPVRRTEAMSLLVSHGDGALGAVRDAIKRSDRAGDHRASSLLEDVRWAILVPDALEARTKVRSALARGTSLERQSAAVRLGRAGKDALPALGELASDSDPLVVESTVRALSAVGGSDAIPAMAALLAAGNPNLRVTAAQALGRSKDTNALRRLVQVVTDSNEVVATTAIAALEEIYGREDAMFGSSRTKAAAPPELAAAFKRAAGDPRWRVRAASAEAAGKLSMAEMLDDLRALLADSDAFVVRSALMSLKAMGSEPDPEQLAATARRVPAVRTEVLQVLAQSADDTAVKAASAIYAAANPEDRASILHTLGARDRYGGRASLQDAWEPLLATAASDTNALVRRAAAVMLGRVGTNVAARTVGRLLSDADSAVRSQAAVVALECLSGSKALEDSPDGMFEMDEDRFPVSGSAKRATNTSVLTPALRAEWRVALQKSGGNEPVVAAAAYALGDAVKELPDLTAAVATADKQSLRTFAKSPALAMIIPRLPWPEGEPFLDTISASPLSYALAMTESASATQAVREFLREPVRFSRAVAPAGDDDLATVLPLLLKQGAKKWTLFSDAKAGRGIAEALAVSTNGGWRAASVYVLSQGGGSNKLALLARAAQDSNAWVRIAGINGLGRSTAGRAALEQSLGPAVGDPDLRVAHAAAVALLEPELRMAAFSSWHSVSFYYNRVVVYDTQNPGGSSDDRPLVALETSPSYLAVASRRADTNKLSDALPFLILLAQHREFDALSKAIERNPQPPGGKEMEMANAMAAAIALSRDTKFLPYVRAIVEGAAKDEWQLRSALRALRGMSGPEVRELRLDINRRIRKTTE